MSEQGIRLVLEGAGKRYQRDWIFKNFSQTFEAGSSWAITGANGSGKSTLVQCLLGYQSLSAGTRKYEMAGQPLAEDQLFKHLSIVTPYLELPEGYTLKELLDFHFGLKSPLSYMPFMELLAEAGLERHLHKQLVNYSSGMKQRVKLILAFGSHTPLLFLDEPTTNLDQAGCDWFDSLMARRMGDNAVSIFVASNQAHEYCRCQHVLRIENLKV